MGLLFVLFFSTEASGGDPEDKTGHYGFRSTAGKEIFVTKGETCVLKKQKKAFFKI